MAHARVHDPGRGHAHVQDGGPADVCVYGAGTIHARVQRGGTAQAERPSSHREPSSYSLLVPPAAESTPEPSQPPQAPAPRRPRFRALRTHFGTAAGAVILGALLWRLGTGVLVDGLRRIDTVTVLAALGIGVVTTVLSAWRWQLVARSLRIRLPLGPAVADYYRALFLNAALPGGILGDVHRAVRHGQSAGDLRRGVKAVVLERVAGQLALAVLAVAVLPTLPSPVRAEARDFAPLVALGLAGALAVVLAVRMNHASARRAGGLRTALGEARQGLFSRRGGPGVALSSAVVLAGHVAMFVVAARVAGSAASVVQLLPLAVLALVAMGLPLNVGGFGPREGVTAWAFGAAGLGASTGVAVAVVYGVLSFVASLPGAVVLAVRWYAGLRADSATADPATTDPATAESAKTNPAKTDRAAPEPTDPDPVSAPDDPRPAPHPAPAPAPAQGDAPGQGTGSAKDYPRRAPDVSNAKYDSKDSARLASSSFPFSADPREGRPMTPDSV
ncbi:lysylphosphatidylglycerol synthase transmembrane domain-containing protein [Streptomyces sp. NPDC007856]|uniref:lysylphosphatidylglycerol synthase transmembrane domain-containing protein n=1 Tax=Streptomyces sp. NPDC007856 TaxID=3364781 RepID=UPI0036C11906